MKAEGDCSAFCHGVNGVSLSCDHGGSRSGESATAISYFNNNVKLGESGGLKVHADSGWWRGG